MSDQEKAWQALINVIFNNHKDISIEYVPEFRKLAYEHKVDLYSDYQRAKKLPEDILQDHWEWEFIENISKILPGLVNVQVLVLKGAAVRDCDLYPAPSLRKSDDLDLFIYGIGDDFQSKRDFVNLLVRNKKLELMDDWENRLRKLNNVIIKYKDKFVDLHFELFLPLGNIVNFGPQYKRQNKYLQDLIVEKALPYRGLATVKKMCIEDLFLYEVFSFVKDFPFSKLSTLLDLYLILNSNKSSLESLLNRAKETNQMFLYNVGIYLLIQVCQKFKPNEKSAFELNYICREFFKLKRLEAGTVLSLRSRIKEALSNGLLCANGKISYSILFFIYYFILNNLYISNLEENKISFEYFENIFTKMRYILNNLKNYLKLLCLKLANTTEKNVLSSFVDISEEKKLITVFITKDIKLTFLVPTKLFDNLSKIWSGFLTNDHLEEFINVDKLTTETENLTSNVIYSNKLVYCKFSNGSYGKADTNSFSGEFFADGYWDVRNFALSLFRATTFEREDLLLVHASAVKIESDTLIFPGGSSAGKTTLFNMLTSGNAKSINDDTLLLKKDDTSWTVYPTPFMSNNVSPIVCDKSRLSCILDPIKVCGGHRVSNIGKSHAEAILLNNALSDFIIDDAGFTVSKLASKVIDISKQCSYFGQIEYSINEKEILIELLNKWLKNPDDSHSHGSNFLRLVAIQGESMEPTFKGGDILYVEEVSSEKLKSKDIICFSQDINDFPTIHRVKYLIKHKDHIVAITKGDKLIFEDPPNAFKKDQKVLKVIGKFDKSLTS